MKRAFILATLFLLAKAAPAQQLGHTVEQEPNDVVANATIAALGDTLFGTISSTTDVDYFAFDVPAGAVLFMTRTGNDENACLIDRDGVAVLGCFPTTLGTGNTFNYPITAAGRYYVRFSASYPDVDVVMTGPYGVAVDTAVYAQVLLPSATLGQRFESTLVLPSALGQESWSLAAGAPPPGIYPASNGDIAGSPSDTGVFVFYLAAASGNTVRHVRATIAVFPVVIPDDQIIAALLGSAPLNPAFADFLDRHGNRNGQLDVGDLRAHLRDEGLIAARRHP